MKNRTLFSISEILGWLIFYNLTVYVFTYIFGKVLFSLSLTYWNKKHMFGLNLCKRNILIGIVFFSFIGDGVYPFWLPEVIKQSEYAPTHERSLVALLVDPFRIERWFDFVYLLREQSV
jgi:hypothetical protein